MLDKADWGRLVPHQGSMCLLDAVCGFDDRRIDARAESHRSAGHPLRRDGQLHAIHLCEYGAQAMALHGALLARAAGGRARPGYLVVLRDVQFAVTRIDDLPAALEIHAERLAGDDRGWQYAFRVTHAGNTLASGCAVVALRDQ